MTPLRIAGATHTMNPPASMEGKVAALQTRLLHGCHVSRWEPSLAELAELLAGGSVELWCMSVQPVVALMVAPHVSEGAE